MNKSNSDRLEEVSKEVRERVQCMISKLHIEQLFLIMNIINAFSERDTNDE